MATTSSILTAGKALVIGRGGDGKGGKGRAAALAAAALGLSLVVGGILGQGRQAVREDVQARPVSAVSTAAQARDLNLLVEQNTPHDIAPGNVALAQTEAGGGYLEFAPGDVPSVGSTASAVPSVAWTQTQAGAGYLEFQPGESQGGGISAIDAALALGVREYLAGEGPIAGPATPPAPLFGPQP